MDTKHKQNLVIAVVLSVSLASCVQQFATPPQVLEPTPEAMFASTLGPNSMAEVIGYATQTAVALTQAIPQGSPTALDMNEVVLYVVMPDGSEMELTRNDVQALGTMTMNRNGIDYQGIPLLVLLDSLNAEGSELHAVTLYGKGSLTLLASQIDAELMLVPGSDGLLDVLLPVGDEAIMPQDVVLITLH